jgi:hypothetical protein
MSSTSSVPKSTTETCGIKLLPPDKRISAAKQAAGINPANAVAHHMLKQAFPDFVITPEHLAVLVGKYWGNSGVQLTVGFLDSPPADLRARILGHMNAWNDTANANVQFVETASDPRSVSPGRREMATGLISGPTSCRLMQVSRR